jgi:hypothetical protein
MTRRRARGSLVQVGAEAGDDAGPDVLAELGLASSEVSGYTPVDLRCAWSFSPVAHQPLGIRGMTLRASGINHLMLSASRWI